MSPVACNIYVTAGRYPQHIPVLTQLLSRGQARCRKITNSKHADTVTIVHAFADPTYNRSSFHLVANSVHGLVPVASQLATEAIREIASSGASNLEASDDVQSHGDCSHPTVGLVDHVSIMPLQSTLDDDSSIDQSEKSSLKWAAHQIGEALAQESNQNVHYYGRAHPNGLPLAVVRREETNFFQSNQGGTSLVGVPAHFVENYNIRVEAESKAAVSRTLTQLLRERDGGIPGVEGLTLAYGKNCWEVALNLLLQDRVPLINRVVEEWKEGTVLTAYRVGTTAVQCQRALDFILQGGDATLQDEIVVTNFQGFLENKT